MGTRRRANTRNIPETDLVIWSVMTSEPRVSRSGAGPGRRLGSCKWHGLGMRVYLEAGGLVCSPPSPREIPCSGDVLWPWPKCLTYPQ